MTVKFSEASELLIKNWKTVKEIQVAKGNLEEELRKSFKVVEGKLRDIAWWNEKWKFKYNKDKEVYITHQDWRHGGNDVIWIGIEDFTSEAVFGTEGDAWLYVWVSNDSNELISDLKRQFETYGAISSKRSYIIRKPLIKCRGVALSQFDKIIIDNIVDFFDHYAQKKQIFSEAMEKARKKWD